LQINALLGDTGRRAAADDGELAGMLLSLRSWALYHLNELGDSLSQAVALGESLVTDLELNRDRYHLDTLGARNNLAAAYQAAGRLDKAIPLFEATLTSREQILGHDHPSTATSWNNLGFAYWEAGRTTEAIALFDRTFEARKRLLGAEHPETLTAWNDLNLARQQAARADRRR